MRWIRWIVHKEGRRRGRSEEREDQRSRQDRRVGRVGEQGGLEEHRRLEEHANFDLGLQRIDFFADNGQLLFKGLFVQGLRFF
jgi:hypothetical protein